jgi:hypothetical protein
LDFYHLPVVSGRLGSAHIEIGTGQNQLTVEGGKKEKQEREYLYRGISTRAIIAVAAGAACILDPLKMEATTLKSTACTPGGL